jgi:hypothetical protein
VVSGRQVRATDDARRDNAPLIVEDGGVGTGTGGDLKRRLKVHVRPTGNARVVRACRACTQRFGEAGLPVLH